MILRSSFFHVHILSCRRAGTRVYGLMSTGASTLLLASTHVHSSSCAPSRLIVGAHWRRIACMHTIALVCQKGGAGKTTMAIHLAVEGQRRGLKTLLIDIDPQASAAKIMDRRGDNPPDVATEAAARLERAIKAAEGQGYELVIVDTAPQADQAAAQAAKVADLVVAPLQPSIVDLDAVDATIDVCKLAGAPILFVLNRVPVQGREIAGTENAIKKRGMNVAATRWGERKAFKYQIG